MNCKHCQKLLHEYVDEALPPRIRISVEEHLHGCDDCRTALAEEQDFSKSMSELLNLRADSLTLGPDIQRNVLQALESGAPSPKTRKSYRRVLLRPAWGLAAAACLLVAAIVALQNHNPQPVRPAPPAVDHPKSYIMCMATIYADETKTDWIERRMIVETRNGAERYLRIVARKPAKEKQMDPEREEES